MLGITDYLWRLIPANPILLRVVETAGKRRRDLFVRCGYLGLLVFLVVFSLLTSGGLQAASLSDLASQSRALFENMSYLQLALVALLSPIFTAGAITQEKDSQTYDILLSTPLTNGQIVLGSLLSRLFFVVALLVSGIPIFSITQIFGGVAISSIVHSFLIAAATAFVTGALAMAIATFKVGTRRTIFSFYLFVVIYLVGLFLLDRLDYFHPVVDFERNATTDQPVVVDGRPVPIYAQTSYFTGIHPFLALRVIFNDPSYTPPTLSDLPEHLRTWPLGWYLTAPHTFYTSFMFFLSAVLVIPSIILLRRLAQSTVSIQGWILQKLRLSKGDRRRKPRGVWNNPIAWREAKTKASAARASILRYGFIAGGLVGALFLVVRFATHEPAPYYINRSSLDASYRMISVYSGEQATTYQIVPQTVITLNGKPARAEALYGEYAVSVTTPSQASKTAATIAARDIPRKLSAADARKYLLGAVIIEFAVILLIVTNAAASTVTREKEDGSLDLLLTTPITSRYYIWGKLRGLVSFVLPLVAVPVVSVLIFVLYDLFRLATEQTTTFQWMVFPESVLILPGMLIIVAAFASILGMQMSLRCRTTVRAVMSSVGIVVGICAVLGWCGYAAIGNRMHTIDLIVGGFSPFTLLTILVDPYTYGGRVFESGHEDGVATARMFILFASWAATGVYALVVWTMYKSMVKNFDMTIRRQSR